LLSEMRKPEVPDLDRYKERLDARLREEVGKQNRVVFPGAFFKLGRYMKALVKPLVQSGAMAMTAIAVIIAISATPAATVGDLVVPSETPLAAPDVDDLEASDSQFVDYLPAEDVLALQKADNSDISGLGME
jgi:hypothetical protein